MAFGMFTLTGHFDTYGGAPAVGKVRITGIPEMIVDPAGDQIFIGPKYVTLDSAGDFTINLPTNVATGQSASIGYRVATGFVSPLSNTMATEFYARAIGAIVDLADLTTQVVEPIGDTTANLIAAQAAQAKAETAANQAAAFMGFGPVSTATIQAKIDAAAVFGGGGIILPPGQHTITASTLNETYDNHGTPVPASDVCLVLRKNVSLIAAGRKHTELVCTDPTKTLVAMIAPENSTVQGMTLTGGYVVGGPGAGMGIITYGTASGADQRANNNLWRDLHIRNVGSYGIGLQAGYPRGCRVEDVLIENSGADGLDLKARGTVQVEPSGNSVINLVVRNHGLRVTGSCGVDVRGIWNLSDITVTDFGTVAGLTFNGIRFRTKDDTPNYWAGVGSRGSLTGFYVRSSSGAVATDMTGLIVGSDSVNVSNGVVAGCVDGVSLQGNLVGAATNTRLTAVHALNNTRYGFFVGTGPSGTTLVGCYTNGSGTAGYRNEGTDTTFIGCDSDDTTVLSTSVSALPSESIIGGSFLIDRATVTMPTAGRVQLAAIGASTDIDLALSPKGAGRLRFGTHTANADAPITGYILIRDETGVTRKLAVIA